MGGLIAGIGMALLEQADWDTRTGRLMHADLAEYLVPVCADAGSVDCLFVPSHEPTFTKLGVKSVAQLVLTGIAPAIGNAVFHATGTRLRSFPIRVENLLDR